MQLKRTWLMLVLTFVVSVGFIDSSRADAALDRQIQDERVTLWQNGFKPWAWPGTGCGDCELVILAKRSELRTEKVRLFIGALQTYKAELLALYGTDGNEYNLLAHMAIGILGRESRFFESTRYQFKENYPALVRLFKILLAGDGKPSASSRGPTQIKVIPPMIENHFGFNEDRLYIPENAAVATMGYLIEALKELKNRIVLNKLNFVNRDNYVDYLPYIYFGSKKTLLSGRARPDRNQYIRDMKSYMTWVEVFEGPRSLPAPRL